MAKKKKESQEIKVGIYTIQINYYEEQNCKLEVFVLDEGDGLIENIIIENDVDNGD